MKKLRFLSLLLALALIFSLMVPTALASSAEGEESTGASASEVQEEAPEKTEPTSAMVRDMKVNAGSMMLVDMDNDFVLYSMNADERIFPASTTKILTALAVLQHIEAGDISMNTTVTCSKTFRKTLTAAAAVANLQTGEKISVESLLYCLMLPSACDAANVLGEAISGSLEAFGDEMNRVAEACGCTGSHFVNPSGLHNKDHYSTCRDLYLIMKEAMKYEDFRKIIGTASITLPETNLSGPRTLKNTNALLKGTKDKTYQYGPCIGGKTGSTYLAGNCLISAAQKDGRTLCCVMMGCNWLINRDGSRDKLQFSESVRLYKWGFENFRTEEVISEGQVLTHVPVADAEDNEEVSAMAVSALSAEMPADVKPEDLTLTYDYAEGLTAPVHAGDPVGSVTVSLDGFVYGTVALAAASDIDPSAEVVRKQRAEAMIDTSVKVAKWVFILAALVVIGFLLLVIRAQIIRYLRRKRRAKHRAKRRRQQRERRRYQNDHRNH